MRVEHDPDGAWSLFDDQEQIVGRLAVLGAALWEWLRGAGIPFRPPRQLSLGDWMDGIGADWPASDWFAGQAAAIRRDASDMLRSYLPWVPYLLGEIYAHEPDAVERRARLALLFWHVALAFDDARLRPTQFALERAAYHALSALYELEPAGSQRLGALRDALKAAFRAWQGTVAADDRAWYFARPDAPADRETEMLDILTLQDGSRRRLRRLFREGPDGRRMVVRLAEGWFLHRYDLERAGQLKAALGSLSADGQAGGYLDAAADRPTWAAVWSLRLTLVVILGYVVLSAIPGAAGEMAWLRWAMMGIYVACGLPPAVAWLTSRPPDTSTPRLLAGVLVALVGTVLQQNWTGVAHFVSAQPLPMVALSAGILIAAFKVLLGKVRRTTEIESPSAGLRLASTAVLSPTWWRDLAVRRSRAIWTRGLVLSFLLSLLVTDLVGDAYLSVSEAVTWRLTGAFGHTYPGLVLLFTALLLFTGVFAQFLWEEEPITEGVA